MHEQTLQEQKKLQTAHLEDSLAGYPGWCPEETRAESGERERENVVFKHFTILIIAIIREHFSYLFK